MWAARRHDKIGAVAQPPDARRLKPYRPNAGIALFAPDGRVLIARRIGDDGPEVIVPGLEWQMPQGGVDPGEDGEAAARRELWEETGVVSARVLDRIATPLRYDFPPYEGPPHKLAAFSGQDQTWWAMAFTGREDEIDVSSPRNGTEPEFDRWRWESLERLPELVVPYKKTVYDRVAAAFRPYATARPRAPVEDGE